MNKNFKIITINGFRGILAAIFVVCGLIAGFVISPGWVCMKLWNWAFEYSNYLSQMNLYQGIMLWVIIALILYALNNKRALIGFGTYSGLNPAQIRDIMEKTRTAEAKILKELNEKRIKEILEKKEDVNPVSIEENEEVKK